MKLASLYPSLSAVEQNALADRAGTTRAYLWQLATQWRGKKPSLRMIRRLASADSRLALDDLIEEFAETTRA